MAVLNIDVVSDPVCPFCYIGKKRLDRAIELYKRVVPAGSEDTFEVTWHPFYLDPNAPKTAVPTLQRLAEKFGADQVPRMMERMTRMGASDGIAFSFGNKTGHTRDAHRLLALAKRKGVQSEVADALFHSYFEADGDITSHDTLVAAAEKGGLASDETRKWLDGDEGGDEVDREVSVAYRAGIHGVPKFTINNKFQVDGAQDVETFLDGLVKAKEALKP